MKASGTRFLAWFDRVTPLIQGGLIVSGVLAVAFLCLTREFGPEGGERVARDASRGAQVATARLPADR